MTNDLDPRMALLQRLEAETQPIRPEISELPFQPDTYVESLDQLDLDDLLGAGVRHVLIDYDGVLIGGDGDITINPAALAFCRTVVNHPKIETFHVASQNMGELSSAAEEIGASIRIFQPHTLEDGIEVQKFNPEYYAHILEELGELDDPASVVMIGDTPYDDVYPAQEVGMQTVLVKSLLS